MVEQPTTPVHGAGGANRFSALYNLLDPEDTERAHVEESLLAVTRHFPRRKF